MTNPPIHQSTNPPIHQSTNPPIPMTNSNGSRNWLPVHTIKLSGHTDNTTLGAVLINC